MTTRTLPRVHGQLAVLNGRTVTPKTKRGGGIAIGIAHVPKPPKPGSEALRLQSALLDKRTARPLPLIRRIAGAVWRWM